MWNSVEIAELIVSALTPLVVVGLGVFVARSVRRLEDAPVWDDYFADPAEVAKDGYVEDRYRLLMRTFSEQVGVRSVDADVTRG